MQGIKLIEETKTDNPWGGKHIIRKMQGLFLIRKETFHYDKFFLNQQNAKMNSIFYSNRYIIHHFRKKALRAFQL